MTLTKNSKLYPGMSGTGIEFFTVEGEVKALSNGQVKDFTQLPFATIQLLDEAINEDYDARLALLEWHPNSKYDRLQQFASCRFGGLDFKAYIQNHILQKGEYLNCSVRATCVFNGKICNKPMFKEVELTPADVTLMQLTSTSLTNETIAEEMQLAFGTFHKLKKQLYAKLGVQTKQEVALIANYLNII